MSKVWINGRLITASQATIAINDRGFTLGDGLFETMLWTGTQIRFFDDHMARLSHACDALGFVLPLTVGEIEAGLNELCTDGAFERAAVRLTLTRGLGPRGLALPPVAEPLLLATISAALDKPDAARLITVAIARNCGAPSARFKTMSYMDNVIALSHARAKGGDDAIMLGTTGNVACASSANIIIHHNGKLVTPAIDDGALPGIVRGRLIAAGQIEEARVTNAMLATCTGAALTNAIVGVRAVASIDGRKLVLEPNTTWLDSLTEVLKTPNRF